MNAEMEGAKKERDRIFRILIQEIRLNIKSKNRWKEDFPGVEDHVRYEQVIAFSYQVASLALLGSKMFGLGQAELIKLAEKEEEI